MAVKEYYQALIEEKPHIVMKLSENIKNYLIPENFRRIS